MGLGRQGHQKRRARRNRQKRQKRQERQKRPAQQARQRQKVPSRQQKPPRQEAPPRQQKPPRQENRQESSSRRPAPVRQREHQVRPPRPPKRRRRGLLAAVLLLGAALTVGLVARPSLVGNGSTNSEEARDLAKTFNAGLSKQVSPSERRGGTLRFVLSGEPDSMDPGNTSYPYNWNFTRLYARPLLSYQAAPGKEGLTLVPDLARDLGTPSDGGLTWTYKLRKGIRYEDGTEVTASDVEYAIARSNYTNELVDGPHYFAQYLQQGTYKGPYKDNDLTNFPGITAPDRYTLVFHLTQPFAEFDFLVANPQTAPVPPGKDKHERYEQHPLSTGPYKFADHRVGSSLTLVPNDEWDPATDATRKQLVNRIVVREQVDPQKVDEMLLSGEADIALDGTGVQSAQPEVLEDPELKGRADNPVSGYTRFGMISTKVPPFGKPACRQAVQYAADRRALRKAWGGPMGGNVATTLLPPNVLGHERATTWDAGPKLRGNLGKARQALAECGKQNGFSTTIAVRGDLAQDRAAARALQKSLGRVGIRATVQTYPSARWSAEYAGRPAFVHKRRLGIQISGWGADWPSGYGFLPQLVDGGAIRQSGNFNQMELDDPAVNRLVHKGIRTLGTEARNEVWSKVDRKVMESAAFLPIVHQKVLLYRPPTLTNVYVHPAYGMYDYAVIGKR